MELLCPVISTSHTLFPNKRYRSGLKPEYKLERDRPGRSFSPRTNNEKTPCLKRESTAPTPMLTDHKLSDSASRGYSIQSWPRHGWCVILWNSRDGDENIALVLFWNNRKCQIENTTFLRWTHNVGEPYKYTEMVKTISLTQCLLTSAAEFHFSLHI